MAEERTAVGRLFHDLGPATANARSPIVDRRVAGTTRSVNDADRRRRRTVPPTGVASSVKYRGAAPLRQRYMSTDSFVLDATSLTSSCLLLRFSNSKIMFNAFFKILTIFKIYCPNVKEPNMFHECLLHSGLHFLNSIPKSNNFGHIWFLQVYTFQCQLATPINGISKSRC